MTTKTLIGRFLLVFCFFGTDAYAQQTTPSPTPKVDKERPPIKLSFPKLKDELVQAEIEPRLKQFKMNIRFLRAEYSRRASATETVIVQQYMWTYFSEAVISLQIIQYPARYFSLMPAEESKMQIGKLMASDIERANGKTLSEKDINIGSVHGKEFDVSIQGKIVKARTFTYRDVRYVLFAQPKTDDAGPLIQKLFDSFEFIPVRN